MAGSRIRLYVIQAIRAWERGAKSYQQALIRPNSH